MLYPCSWSTSSYSGRSKRRSIGKEDSRTSSFSFSGFCFSYRSGRNNRYIHMWCIPSRNISCNLCRQFCCSSILSIDCSKEMPSRSYSILLICFSSSFNSSGGFHLSRTSLSCHFQMGFRSFCS